MANTSLDMKVLDKLLGASGPGVVYAQPPLTGSELEEFWCELSWSIEFLRVLVERRDLCGTQVLNTFDGMLEVVERISLPPLDGRGRKERLV